MIPEILKIGSLITLIYQAKSHYRSNVCNKLDSPENNSRIRGLDKAEIKLELLQIKQEKQELTQLIKNIELARKNLIATNNKEQAREKLAEKNEKLEELTKLETDLADIETTVKDSYLKQFPSKANLNNAFNFGAMFLIPLLFTI